MSNLLKEAFIDAKALRDVALKNAESTIVEKYSDEVRQTLEKLLEQEEGGLELAPDPLDTTPVSEEDAPVDGEPIVEDEEVPLAATDGFSELDGQNLSETPTEGEDITVNVDLDALQETIRQLQEGVDEEIEINEEELVNALEEESKPDFLDLDKDGDKEEPMKDAAKSAKLEEDVIEEDDGEATEYGDTGASQAAASAAETSAAAEQDKESGYGGEEQVEELEEDFEIPDELIDSIMEKLTVDMQGEKSGWAGRSPESLQWEIEKEMAYRRSTDVEQDMKDLKKAQEELLFENKQLKEQIAKYKQATLDLKEGLQDVNLSNARLLYTNRVLRNTSLNERQKDKIAEAISSAGSVMEAKTIYETLESATPVQTKRAPQSLSEAITRPSSVIRATRQESTKPTDPFMDRMKKLAGIN